MKSSTRSILVWLMIIIIFILFLIIANSTGKQEVNLTGGLDEITYEKAKVVSINDEELEDDKSLNLKLGLQYVDVEIKTGNLKGQKLNIKNYLSYDQNVYCKAGLDVIVRIDTSPTGGSLVSIYQYNRIFYNIIIVAVFFIIMAIVGGAKGIKAIFALMVTFVCILYIFIPLIYKSFSPIFAAIIVVFLSTTTTLFLISGISKKAISAILGTMSGVFLSVIFSYFASFITHISGINMDDAESLWLIYKQTNMQIKQLIFAGIIISSLGAIMDMSMSVASSIQEIYEANKDQTWKSLFISGMNVGKDMIGTMTNTIILAFVGSSLVLIIILYAFNIGVNQLLTTNEITIEIIQAISASLGIILSVPVSAFISSKLFAIK